MLFSIVIPTFNRSGLLEQALDSVRRQSWTDFELIVVDDGSTDSTMEFLQSLGGAVQVLRQANRGPGAARNLGAQRAAGEYLAFLDSDDVWFPWTLGTYAQIIQKANKPDFIAGKPRRFSGLRELESVIGGPLVLNTFADYYASGDEWRWWGVSSFVIRTDAFNAAGGFANEWINGEDADLALRLGEAPGFVQVTAPFTFGYREHAASAMKNLNKTLAGVRYKIRAEKEGKYPGGSLRAHQRWHILTRHIRPVSLDCLRHGMRHEACELYRETFHWHLSLGRWKYLVGFPLKATLLRA